MNLTRPIVFWIAMLAAVIAVIVLLREVLLPFVAALVLAYLLDPLASRIERLGMNRLLATLTIVISAIITVVLLSMLTLPVIVRELEYFIESFPLYIHRLHTLADDANRPWPSKLVGQGLGEAERSIGDLTASASNWAGTFLRSIWSGGRALISMLSLAVVTPIVASYLLYHWNSMIAAIDNWIPPARRETVRALARDIDDTIGGFVRGQSTLCLVLAVFYGVILWLIGLKHGALIGFVAGIVSFVPYIGSLSGLVVSTCIAIAQFWPDWRAILLVPAVFVQRLDSKPGHFLLHRGDVLAYSFQGGGGYGDPIRRDPERVARDVHNGLVTPHWAATLYGVVLRDGAVDAEATRARRHAIRAERLGGRTPKADPPQATGLATVCPAIDQAKRFRCLCGADLGAATESWKPRASRRTVPPQAFGPHITLHAELELREFCCSECGTLLEAEVARRGQEPLVTIVLDA